MNSKLKEKITSNQMSEREKNNKNKTNIKEEEKNKSDENKKMTIPDFKKENNDLSNAKLNKDIYLDSKIENETENNLNKNDDKNLISPGKKEKNNEEIVEIVEDSSKIKDNKNFKKDIEVKDKNKDNIYNGNTNEISKKEKDKNIINKKSYKDEEEILNHHIKKEKIKSNNQNTQQYNSDICEEEKKFENEVNNFEGQMKIISDIISNEQKLKDKQNEIYCLNQEKDITKLKNEGRDENPKEMIKTIPEKDIKILGQKEEITENINIEKNNQKIIKGKDNIIKLLNKESNEQIICNDKKDINNLNEVQKDEKEREKKLIDKKNVNTIPDLDFKTGNKIDIESNKGLESLDLEKGQIKSKIYFSNYNEKPDKYNDIDKKDIITKNISQAKDLEKNKERKQSNEEIKNNYLVNNIYRESIPIGLEVKEKIKSEENKENIPMKVITIDTKSPGKEKMCIITNEKQINIEVDKKNKINKAKINNKEKDISNLLIKKQNSIPDFKIEKEQLNNEQFNRDKNKNENKLTQNPEKEKDSNKKKDFSVQNENNLNDFKTINRKKPEIQKQLIKSINQEENKNINIKNELEDNRIESDKKQKYNEKIIEDNYEIKDSNNILNNTVNSIKNNCEVDNEKNIHDLNNEKSNNDEEKNNYKEKDNNLNDNSRQEEILEIEKTILPKNKIHFDKKHDNEKIKTILDAINQNNINSIHCKIYKKSELEENDESKSEKVEKENVSVDVYKNLDNELAHDKLEKQYKNDSKDDIKTFKNIREKEIIISENNNQNILNENKKKTDGKILNDDNKVKDKHEKMNEFNKIKINIEDNIEKELGKTKIGENVEDLNKKENSSKIKKIVISFLDDIINNIKINCELTNNNQDEKQINIYYQKEKPTKGNKILEEQKLKKDKIINDIKPTEPKLLGENIEIENLNNNNESQINIKDDKDLKQFEKEEKQIIKEEDYLNNNKILDKLNNNYQTKLINNDSTPEKSETNKENEYNNEAEKSDLSLGKQKESFSIEIEEEKINSDEKLEDIPSGLELNYNSNTGNNIINNVDMNVLNNNEKNNKSNDNGNNADIDNQSYKPVKNEKFGDNIKEEIQYPKKNQKQGELLFNEDEKENEQNNKINKKEEFKHLKGEDKVKKIEFAENYLIDDNDKYEIDDNKNLIKEKNNAFSEKPYLKVINKQIINTLHSINSGSPQREKEELNNNLKYSNSKSDINKKVLQQKDSDIDNTEKNVKTNEIEFISKILPIENNKISKNKDFNIINNDPKDIKITNNIISNAEIERDYLEKEKNKKQKGFKDINKNKNSIEKFDIIGDNLMNKEVNSIKEGKKLITEKIIINLMKFKNPLYKYFKKWNNISYTKEIKIQFNEKIDGIKNKENELGNEQENKQFIGKDNVIKNKIYSPKNKEIEYIEQKQLFISNVQKRIVLKKKLIKYINNLQNNQIKQYFNIWKNKIISNNESQFNTIITRINKNKNISRRKFIPGKKVLPFEKLESKLNEPSKVVTPRPTNDIIIQNEKKQKRKILIKYIIKKNNEENNNFIKRYFNIWKEILQNDNELDNNKTDDHNKIIKDKDKKFIPYKKRKIKEILTDIKYELEDLNNELRGNNANYNYKLYFKQKTPDINYISSLKNDKNYNEKEKTEIINDLNNKSDGSIKDVIKRFILPMPNKEKTKEYPLILNPIRRKEDSYEINLDLNLSDIKQTPKMPHRKEKKKSYNNKLINKEYNKENEELNKDSNKNKNNNNVKELENNSDKNIPAIRTKIIYNITTESEENNTISLKNDSPVENKDFIHNESKRENVIQYKKIIKNEKYIFKHDKGRIIGRNYNKKENNFEEGHIKSKTFISDYIGIKKEENSKNKKFNLDNKLDKIEYTFNYNDLILCEEIVYKTNEATIEKKINIKTVKKPKIYEKNTTGIKHPIRNNFSKEKKSSIFLQKVIRYKRQEKKCDYGNLNQILQRIPINPNDVEINISELNPFNKSSENFYKKENKKFDKIISSPDVCITDRGEKRQQFNQFKSPQIRFSSDNNNIFDDYYYTSNEDNYYSEENEVIDEELRDKINKELNLTKKLTDFHSGFLENLPDKIFKSMKPNILYSLIKNNNKKLALWKIFYIYGQYKINNYLLKREYLRRWQKSVNFIDIDIKVNSHIINKSGHCISAKNIVIKEIRCGIHPDNVHHINCFCFRIRLNLKKILLRHFLLKFLNKEKFYLFKWYKKTFKKIRPLYLIS